MIGSVIGYARVSRVDQDPELQLTPLREAGCDPIFVDRISGGTHHRPQLDKMLDYLRPGDTLIIWKLDRLGRNLSHLIQLSEKFEKEQISLVSLTEAIDTRTPSGRLMYGLLAVVAEFERSLVRERTAAAISTARANGHFGGRPRKLTVDRVKAAQQLRNSGQTVKAVALLFGVSPATIMRYTEQVSSGHDPSLSPSPRG